MDDEIPAESESGSIYIFPALVTAHVYPMRIYKQTSKLNVRKPFCAQKKQYAQFLQYTAMLKQAKQQLKKAETEKDSWMLEFLQNEYAQIQKQHQSIARSGKFFMYTASNKDRCFENPWYCLFRVEMENIAQIEHCEKVFGEPNNYQLTHTHNFIPHNQEAKCTQTLEQFVEFFSSATNVLHIGPLITYTYAALQKNKKWKISGCEHDMLANNAGDWDVRDLYALWPEHDTRDQLKELIVDNDKAESADEEDDETIGLTNFAYDVSPSSSPDSCFSVMHDIAVQKITEHAESKANSKRYKLS